MIFFSLIIKVSLKNAIKQFFCLSSLQLYKKWIICKQIEKNPNQLSQEMD